MLWTPYIDLPLQRSRIPETHDQNQKLESIQDLRALHVSIFGYYNINRQTLGHQTGSRGSLSSFGFQVSHPFLNESCPNHLSFVLVAPAWMALDVISLLLPGTWEVHSGSQMPVLLSEA